MATIDTKTERDFNAFDYCASEREVIYRRWCRDHSISYTYYEVLSRLMHVQDISPSELADAFDIPRQSMTNILDSLEEEGYVIREPHPSDRRRKAIKLTDKGRDYVEETFGKVHEQEVTAYTSLSEEDRDELGRLMRTYVDALAKYVD